VPLTAGPHTVTVGGYLNQKTHFDEESHAYFDDIVIVQSNLPVFFIDNFQDGNADAWTVIDDSGKISDWQVVEGKYYQFADRVDRWELSYHLGSFAYYNDADAFNRRNYHVGVKMRSLSEIYGTRDDIGLMVRYIDQNNYLRISVSKMQGYIRLEKIISGTFSTLAFNGRPPALGTTIDIKVDVKEDTIFVYVNNEPLFSVSDPDLANGNALDRGTIGLYAQSIAEFDDVIIRQLDTVPKIVISQPTAYSVETTDQDPSPNEIVVSAEAMNVPPDGGVQFALDSNAPCEDYTAPFSSADCPAESGFSNIAQGDHSVTAIIVDDIGIPLFDPNGLDSDTNQGIGVFGKCFILLGDSILNGVGDDSDELSIDTQNDAANGKNLNRGVAPILNDFISSLLPGPVAVYNEGLGGTSSSHGRDRLGSTIERYTKKCVWLILFGTNDSALSVNVPDGSDCTEQDFLNNEPDCIGTFKYNLREIILDLQAQGHDPVLAKVPYPKDAPQQRLDLIEKYNLAISQLTGEHNLLAGPPDFYNHFFENQDSELFDNVHPNGAGYSSMAKLWFCELIPNIIPGTKPSFCN
jgi:lysophospholipase L1-like esterase